MLGICCYDFGGAGPRMAMFFMWIAAFLGCLAFWNNRRSSLYGALVPVLLFCTGFLYSLFYYHNLQWIYNEPLHFSDKILMQIIAQPVIKKKASNYTLSGPIVRVN